jgi:hypothetical protein
MELLIESVQPFLSLEWLLSFLEYWWLGVLEVFEINVLIWFWPLMLTTTMGLILHQSAHDIT